MMAEWLTEHFSLEELTKSDLAARLGIDNTPGERERSNLVILAVGLERVRRLLGCPMIVSSGFRCERLNAATPGSSPSSAHRLGLAADFHAPEFGPPIEVARAIKRSALAFDQLIYEYRSWVHFSVDPRLRLMVLTKHSGQQYQPGLLP